MSCFHPLTGFYTGLKTAKGEDEIVVTSADRHFLPLYFAVKRVGHNIPYNPDFVVIHDGESCLYNTVSIPCGHCDGCRSDRSLDWAVRCCFELRDHDQYDCFFATLTMDNAHVMEPSKEWIQRFLKRLRKRYGSFRYLLCAEYGSRTFRPHYHAIFFGLKGLRQELKLWSKSGRFSLYRSADFEKIYGLGACLFGDVSFDSCAYVAKYATKSEKGLGCFLMMSRRPGLGASALQDAVGSFDGTDSRFYGDFGSRHVVRFPRLFKQYLKDSDRALYDKFAVECRKRAESSAVSNAFMRSLDNPDYLGDVEENIFLSRKKARNIKL